MEALSRREEEEIEVAAKAQAMKLCDDYIRAFADCAFGRTFTVPFVCRDKLKEAEACLKPYMSEERLDAMKLDYIANRSEKGRQAVEALIKARKEKLLKMAGLSKEPGAPKA
ncbi:hypothetical protein Q5752_004902 [Cryptotrichosporon argae]